MSKSQVNALLHVLQGFRKDILAAYPALEGSLSKDFDRLTLGCRSRGLNFLCLDLPNLDSILTNGLESGRLALSGPLSKAVSKRVKVPRLFSGLWLRIFDNNACLKHDVDVTSLAFLRQICSFAKRLEVGCSQDRIYSTLGGYHDIERKLRSPTLRWDRDNIRCLPSDGVSKGDRCVRTPDLFRENVYYRIHDRIVIDSGCFDFPARSSALAEELVGVNDNHTEASLYINDDYTHLHFADVCSLRPYHIPGESDLFEESFDSEMYRFMNKVQQVADLITSSFDPFDAATLSDSYRDESNGVGFKHGPGAVSERLKNWEKSEFYGWSDKLDSTFPFESFGKIPSDSDAIRFNHESPSRLICVPKTRKSPRLIAAESTSHMWCQQLLLRYFETQFSKVFKTFFIDLKDQNKSAIMVEQASIDRKLATVDLSDASDRLSCWTVERLFRMNPSVLNALHAARTRYIRDEISYHSDFLKPKKFASQGTATTFPVMSLTMLVIALASSLDDDVSWGSIWKLRDQVRVFGDDIILPTHGYGRLMSIMDSLQLKVNSSKSFYLGNFRESCGSDRYLGYDVTPTKPKHIVADSPASCQAVVDTTNNLLIKGYWNASIACSSLLPPRVQRGLRIVGRNDAGRRGLTSFSGSDESHLEKRWNTSLHRNEVRVWSLFDQSTKRPRQGYSALLDFFASKHNPFNSRTVSEYADTRKSKAGLLWEPSCMDSNYPTPPTLS